MQENRESPRHRRLFRVGLRTLLVLVACVAAFLGGHRAGFRAGYSKAALEYGDESHGSYDVSDLVYPLSEDAMSKLLPDGGGFGSDQ